MELASRNKTEPFATLAVEPRGILGEWYQGRFVSREAASAALFQKPFIRAASRAVLRAPNKEHATLLTYVVAVY